jgi:amidase
VILAPAAQVPPFPVGLDWPRQVDGVPMGDYLDWMRACWLFSTLGVPCMSLPAGVTGDGLPVGAQLLGPAGSDVRLLQIALAVEEALAQPMRDPFAD